MLKQLSLTNWKSFGPEGPANPPLQFAPLTLLVGPNASGKSNALDALRFLQGAALFSLGDVLRGHSEAGVEIWPPIRGGVVEAAHAGTDTFTLGARWEVPSGHVRHRIVVSTEGEVTASDDSIDLESGGHAGIARASHSPWSRLARVRNDPPPPADLAFADEVGRELREAVFLDIRPSLMRAYRPLNGGHLGTSGENVSPVLAALPEDKLADVVDWLSELCGPEIACLEFDVTKLREVMMILVERGGRKISARSVSDGTLRFLGLVVALLTAPTGALLVIEEPDVGLHPSRIRLLAELLENLTRKRHIQVIATTHSATLLAHLSPESLANVVAFGRDADTGDTHCRRLGELPHFETLRDSKNIEQLISTGWLERAL